MFVVFKNDISEYPIIRTQIKNINLFISIISMKLIYYNNSINKCKIKIK